MLIKFETGTTPIINIDPEDCWSLDETLATIIHPLLLMLKTRLSTSELSSERNIIKKLDTMIYAFERISDNTQTDYTDPLIKEGLANFATFYYLLWD